MTRVIGIPEPPMKFGLIEPFVYQLTHWFPYSLGSIKFYEAFSPCEYPHHVFKIIIVNFNVLSIVQGQLRTKKILTFNVLSIIPCHLNKKEFLTVTACQQPVNSLSIIHRYVRKEKGGLGC